MRSTLLMRQEAARRSRIKGPRHTSMCHVTGLEAKPTGAEISAAPSVGPLNNAHDLGSHVAMVILEYQFQRSFHSRPGELQPIVCVRKHRRWCQCGLTGGLKLLVVAFHFGVKAITSVMATPGIFDFAVKTVYTDGSLWSRSTTAVLMNLSSAYL